MDLSYRMGDTGRIPCAYNFVYSPPYASLEVAPGVFISKQGWDYLWVYGETKQASSNEKATFIPLAYIVDRTLFHNDFASVLGINP